MDDAPAKRYGPPPQGPRASFAAFLSFLFPGLGQAYNGETGLAVLLAAPVVVLIGLIVLVLGVASSQVLTRLFDFRFLIGLIVLDLVLLGWRLIAVMQAHGYRAQPTIRSRASWATALLVVVTLAMHAVPAYYVVKAIDTLDSVALGGSHGPTLRSKLPAFGRLLEPSGQPDVTRGDRVNVLLVGIDSAPGRTTQLTDTMLVVSLDPDGSRSAMISIPRDLYGVPLPDGAPYNQKLNSLMSFAGAHPADFPQGGVETLKATVGKLLGVPIHYFAAVNLLGFKQTVDSIGGVDIVVKRAVSDPSYVDEYGHHVGFYIKPGAYHMNGHTALGFARSRKGAGDNDFVRADRQQDILTAIREKLTAGNLMLALPGLLDAVKNTIATDVPSGRLAALAAAVQGADVSQLQRIVLQPPEFMSVNAHSSAGYILIPDLAAILAIGEQLVLGSVGEPSVQPSGGR
ncbi:MAG: LCP family protein [Chloroflexota bacterium]